MFLKIESEYETGIVKALEKLPCTTYVFPLENDLIIILFHNDENKILALLKKMKEIDIVNDYLLYVPVASGV